MVDKVERGKGVVSGPRTARKRIWTMLFKLERWPLTNRRRSFSVPALDANAQFSRTLEMVGG